LFYSDTLGGSGSGGRGLRGWGSGNMFLLFGRRGRAVVGYCTTLGADIDGRQPFLALVFGGASKFTILFFFLVTSEPDPKLALLRIARGG
jgi:hypothetical protein